MRKKIALFANGWTTENITAYTSSLMNSLPENYADLYMFISYESYGQTPETRSYHRMAFKLPDLSRFDVAIVFHPGLNFAESIEYIYDAIDRAGIPAISICNKREGYYNIGVDNYAGMVELCNHIIKEHHCTSSLFIAGSAENEDSNIRLKAVNDVLTANHLPLPEVYYSNWEAGNAKDYLQKQNFTKDNHPDVVFCANDQLATFSVLAFEEIGFKVPDDFIITGFDHIHRGQIFYPSISSVDQNFDKIGALSSELITKIFNGTASFDDIIIPCSFAPAESCGCGHICNSDELRKKYTHNFPYMDQMDVSFKGRMFALEETILKSSDYTSLKFNLRMLFLNNTVAEGNSFFFMMDPNFKDIGKDLKYTPYTFCDEMDVIIAKFKGDIININKCETTDLLPSLEEYEGNHFHLFSPIFFENFTCGYIVVSDSLALIDESKFYDYSHKIIRTLISYKHSIQLSELNIKLSELMEQDALTRVKNRNAYDNHLKRLERDFIEGENDPFAVIYFDINNLKKINDMYGHEKGDAYIRNSCRLICNTFKHSPVFRIGGDEFVCIAINDDFKNRYNLLSQMREHMMKLKEKGESVPLTERISIASGMAEYDRTLDENFASIFKRADEIMYENKYKMKQES